MRLDTSRLDMRFRKSARVNSSERGLGLGSVFSPTFAQLSDVAQLGVGLLSLRYGRDDERQSDDLGVQYMSTAGYDPRK